MTTHIELNRGSRYNGRVVVEDKQNNKKYLGDLVYYNPGDNLTGWVLGGTTQPTIGSLPSGLPCFDFYDNINLANQTSLTYIMLPNTGGLFYQICSFKFTKQLDDTSTDIYEFAGQIGASTSVGRGHGYSHRVASTRYYWLNATGLGLDQNITTLFPAIAGQEQEIVLIITPKNTILMGDGDRIASNYTFISGASPPGATPFLDFLKDNKVIYFYARHDAGEVTHYKVRDITVARLAGVSSL